MSAGAKDAEQWIEFARDLVAVIALLASEGERSLVIGGAARIDVAVERLLKAVMSRARRGKDDNLFHPDRPLGTFSAKIDLAHRLGLSDDDVERALQLIRKIRNDFAHATTDVRLLQPPRADRVREIVKCVRTIPAYDRMYDNFFSVVSRSGRSAKRNELVASLAVALSFIAAILELAAGNNGPMKDAFVANFRVRPKNL
jgi:hypothetical protein